METYMFDVTLRVQHEGKAVYTILYRGCRADSEHAARRTILQDFLADGWQVAKMERTTEADIKKYGRLKDGR